MQTAEADLTRIEHFLDSWHQRQADTMAQLDQVKPEFRFDFAQHFTSGGVSPGVPTCGERNHRLRLSGVRGGERDLC